jgi:acetoin utilization protein AcuB
MAKLTIRDFMTASPHTIDLHDSLARAAEIMHRHRIRHLPVLSGGHLMGMLSERDVHLVQSFKKESLDQITVELAMSSDPFEVGPSTPLELVAREMADSKYGAAAVVEGGKVVGVFTTIDALRALVRLLGEGDKA